MNSKVSDRIATGVFVAIAVIIVALLFSLLGYILFKGLSVFPENFLTKPSSTYGSGGGIRDQLFNSFYMLVLTMIITIPLGVGGGIYMAEYARPGRLTDIVRTCIEVLASLPSIVIGVFGLLVFVQLTGWGYTLIGGALAVSIFNLPVMVRVTEDAIRSVPGDQKQASLALGVTKWHTIKTVLIPAAIPSIITGAILAAGRVFGEAAALLFTAGQVTSRVDYGNWNPFSDNSPLNPFRTAETLSVHIWAVETQSTLQNTEVVAGAAAAVLVIFVLIFNLLARLLGSVIYKKITATK